MIIANTARIFNDKSCGFAGFPLAVSAKVSVYFLYIFTRFLSLLFFSHKICPIRVRHWYTRLFSAGGAFFRFSRNSDTSPPPVLVSAGANPPDTAFFRPEKAQRGTRPHRRPFWRVNCGPVPPEVCFNCLNIRLSPARSGGAAGFAVRPPAFLPGSLRCRCRCSRPPGSCRGRWSRHTAIPHRWECPACRLPPDGRPHGSARSAG